MSQPVPPPYPSDPNDAPQQPGQPQPGQPSAFGYPMAPPPAPVRDNLAGGVVVALVVALVAAGIYGALGGAIEREVSYAALGVGFVIGFAAGKVGGRNPVLPFVSAALALVAIYLGELLGAAIIIAKSAPVSVSELFFQNFGLLSSAWKESLDFMSFVFLALGVIAAFSGARKAAA
ncbi:hypothetical protein OG204_22995 [Streptomyces sp. NBC_01387]|uniref:hypothetical protein n=1 Tax=unclassified Streptomyces TaxID=2593676 RepID=UPI00202572A5|nr:MULTISPECIES: hypothetical protein [unclassified Streptomyces]MCX4548809.1 hypothetical protein [Streptomyces sp. NBC_01500]WSC20395.1 hypothetical protein OIE60_12255 [Streptomyces sp. NBC_01766]WSV54428.1 hypothetical protein OG282_12315 [Streptomyces sp. NBC_01014]